MIDAAPERTMMLLTGREDRALLGSTPSARAGIEARGGRFSPKRTSLSMLSNLLRTQCDKPVHRSLLKIEQPYLGPETYVTIWRGRARERGPVENQGFQSLR